MLTSTRYGCSFPALPLAMNHHIVALILDFEVPFLLPCSYQAYDCCLFRLFSFPLKKKRQSYSHTDDILPGNAGFDVNSCFFLGCPAVSLSVYRDIRAQ